MNGVNDNVTLFTFRSAKNFNKTNICFLVLENWANKAASSEIQNYP
jgi:hypothetical protein